MLGIGYKIKNQFGVLTPYDFKDYTDYEAAKEFYETHKAEYEAKGVHIELVNIPEE